jgi:hypothetical protein
VHRHRSPALDPELPPSDREISFNAHAQATIRRVDPRATEVRQHERAARAQELAKVGH